MQTDYVMQGKNRNKCHCVTLRSVRQCSGKRFKKEL